MLFHKELIGGKGRWDSRALIGDGLRYLRHMLLPERLGSSSLAGLEELGRDRVLCTWVRDTPNRTGLVLPVVRQLGPERCLVLAGAPALRQRLDAEIPFLTWEMIPPVRRRDWYRDYRSCRGKWHAALMDALRRNGVAVKVALRIHRTLMCQCRRVAAHSAFLRRLQPRAILTEHDRAPEASCLVLAARALGIPTFTMLHGMIAIPYGYTPLAADTVFCWGELSRKKMIEFGVEHDRIEVVGCQALTRQVQVSQSRALLKVGLGEDRPVVLLATNPIRSAPRRQFFRAFCAAFAGDDRFTTVARLHASEDVTFYVDEMQEFPQVRVLDNDAWSLDEAIAAADVVVCHQSAFAFDALARGTPVVILDAIDEPLGAAQDLVDSAGCPRVGGGAELVAAVDRITRCDDERQAVLAKAEPFLRKLCSAYGDEATQRLIRRLLEIVDSGPGAEVASA